MSRMEESIESSRIGEEKEEGDLFYVHELLDMFDSYQGHDREIPSLELDYNPAYIIEEEREITDEELARYEDQLRLTEGFDMEFIPGVSEIGQIIPLDLSRENEMEESVFFTKMAIDEYNRRFKATKGELVFDEVLKAMVMAVNGIRYYLTFNAKNLAEGGESITYQAVALKGSGTKDKVNSFRGPTASGSKMEWFWVGHLCGCSSDD